MTHLIVGRVSTRHRVRRSEITGGPDSLGVWLRALRARDSRSGRCALVHSNLLGARHRG